MEKARALLVQTQAQKLRLVEVALTATQLIYRLPSSTLLFTSPIDKTNSIFPHVQLKNFLSLRISGYICYLDFPFLGI